MGPDYLSLFLNYPDPQALLLLLFLGFMRMAPIVILAPFFGAKLIPGPVKVGLIVTLSLIFLPQLMFETPTPLTFTFTYLGYCGKELFIGAIIGFLVSIPFHMASTSGTLVDHQRGSASLLIFNPALQEQVSPIGLLYNYVLIALFFGFNGAYYFLDAVSTSYTVVPPTTWLNPAFFGGEGQFFWQGMIAVGNDVITVATKLAAPPLVAMLMSDLFLGIANRMATQVPMAFLGWALKSLVGMVILFLAWFFILQQLEKEVFDWLRWITRLIDALLPAQ
ncbi:MAG: EscT/YscT/HrcT family type III secretion system export apparatus protein [Parachlamydiales bacterium]